MWWATWEIIKSLAASFTMSRIGQTAIVVAISWALSWHYTSLSYEKKIAAEKSQIESAYRQEIQREEFAAREIAEAATRRAEDDLEAAKDMQEIIDEYARKLKGGQNAKVTINHCSIDDDFAGVVQQLSKANDRHTRASKRSKKFWKTR